MGDSLHIVAFAQILVVILCLVNGSALDPTHGFTKLTLNTTNFHIHKPYNLPTYQRYSFAHGVHKLWVFSDDEPFSIHSPTKPRTEILISGHDYSSGVWQFEGHAYVPKGTSGVCIMQVFGASKPRATTAMLRVYDGSLTYYRGPPVLAPRVYNKWLKVNVIHDVGAEEVKIYVDNKLRHVAPGRGGDSHYFKFGVYAQNNDSHYMESRWKGIKVLRKCSEV